MAKGLTFSSMGLRVWLLWTSTMDSCSLVGEMVQWNGGSSQLEKLLSIANCFEMDSWSHNIRFVRIGVTKKPSRNKLMASSFNLQGINYWQAVLTAAVALTEADSQLSFGCRLLPKLFLYCFKWLTMYSCREGWYWKAIMVILNGLKCNEHCCN